MFYADKRIKNTDKKNPIMSVVSGISDKVSLHSGHQRILLTAFIMFILSTWGGDVSYRKYQRFF